MAEEIKRVKNKEIQKEEGENEPNKIPSELDDVEEYDAEELGKEIEDSELLEDESPEDLLEQIREERRQLEEERKKLLKEKEQNQREIKKEKEKEEKKEEEEKPIEKPKGIKSFAKERRKRKQLERTRTYLFAGEYVLLIILISALLYAEGISFDPPKIPLENSIYLLIIFLLVMKGERFLFRYMNMKYSGTLQRKSIGVDHYRGLEIPPTLFIAFILAVFVIPPTREFIELLIEILSFNDAIPFSSAFMFNLTMLIIASLVMSIVWIAILMWYKTYVLAPEWKKIAEPFVVEDVFLITHSGLLIKHITRELKPGVDDDILTGMLTAVKDFVKDSFRANEEGELDELQYGKLRIIIEYGRHVYLAAVIRGQESRQLRPEMKRVVRGIHRKFGRVLADWDGNLNKLKGVENLMGNLVKETENTC